MQTVGSTNMFHIVKNMVFYPWSRSTASPKFEGPDFLKSNITFFLPDFSLPTWTELGYPVGDVGIHPPRPVVDRLRHLLRQQFVRRFGFRRRCRVLRGCDCTEHSMFYGL